MKNEKENTICLYTCESVVNAYEYKKMAKHFPEIYWTYVFWGTILNLVFSSIISIALKNYIFTSAFFLSYQMYLMILYKVRLEHLAERSFNRRNKKVKESDKRYTEFYEDYFIRQSENEAFKFSYTDIHRFVETDTNFYLKNKAKNRIVIIQKSTCDSDLIHFIRNKFKS